jgi:DNA adenine methylase
VFGGGAGFLLNKEPSYLEVYNDLDDELYNFFMVLKHAPWELAAALQWMPISRKLIGVLNDTPNDQMTEVERAAKLFYISNLGFSGTRGANLPATTMRRAYRNKIGDLIDFGNRMVDVVIENLDFEDVIKRYDSPDTVFYCDPPYAGLDYYGPSFGEDEHQRLANALYNIKGKACISYYPHPQVAKLYSDGTWTATMKEVSIHSSGKEKKDQQYEMLITNYDPKVDKWESSKHNTLDNFGFPSKWVLRNVPLGSIDL